MIKSPQLAFLSLVVGAVLSVFYSSNPPATAGGTDPHSLSVDPVAIPTSRDTATDPPATAADTGPRLPLDPVAKLRTLPQPLPEGEEIDKNPSADAGGSDLASLSVDPVAIPTSRDTETGPPAAPGFTDADFASHVEQLKKKLPSPDFTIVVQKPFVVIGDESADAVKEPSIRTVKRAVDKLKQEYFSKDPKEILDIWLFKDAVSYERNAKLLFGSKPNTPYGYYSNRDKALVMNISTGGGTLVHEIVHPFIEANFPDCPPWLNEGLGSLYEQSGEVNGRIHGFTNWRLHGLQADIKARQVPSFRKLLGMSVPEFYNFESGSHYAQARYLLYYLQQKGLLTKFYRESYAHRKTDPTGYQTLRRVLGNPDMNVFKAKWEKYVLGLVHQ